MNIPHTPTIETDTQFAWLPLNEIGEISPLINQLHFDTRDFHFLPSTEISSIDFTMVVKLKSKKHFVYDTLEEMLNEVKALQGKVLTPNWKYLRCYKTGYGWVICDSNNYILNKK